MDEVCRLAAFWPWYCLISDKYVMLSQHDGHSERLSKVYDHLLGFWGVRLAVKLEGNCKMRQLTAQVG